MKIWKASAGLIIAVVILISLSVIYRGSALTGFAVAVDTVRTSADLLFLVGGLVLFGIVTMFFMRIERQPDPELEMFNVHQPSYDTHLLEYYIDYSLSIGRSKDFLRRNLLYAGWEAETVDMFLRLH